MFAKRKIILLLLFIVCSTSIFHNFFYEEYNIKKFITEWFTDDEKIQKISLDLIQKNNYKTFPHPFNLRLSNIMNLDITKELKLDFGEVKRLIDWF